MNWQPLFMEYEIGYFYIMKSIKYFQQNKIKQRSSSVHVASISDPMTLIKEYFQAMCNIK